MTIALEQQNRELVLGALASAKAGDIDGFLNSMHDEVRIHEPAFLPYGGLYVGAARFLELFGEAAAVLDLAEIELISATADDGRTVLLMTAPLLSTGELVHITEHWSVENGLVTDVRVFWFEHPAFN